MFFNRGKIYGPDERALKRIKSDLKSTFGSDIDISEVRLSSRNDWEIILTIIAKEDSPP